MGGRRQKNSRTENELYAKQVFNRTFFQNSTGWPNNEEFIPNFGERRRNGEMISTAFVESTVNQVISKRMVKKQQIRWTPRGAHLLLQIRTKALNNELEEVFRHWYPQFRAAPASALAFWQSP